MIYIDDQGRKVLVSQGIGRTIWGAFRIKPSGSLERIRSVPMADTRTEAQRRLDEYAAKRGWKKEEAV